MKNRGFSLIELIIVISVIAAISAIVVPSLSGINSATQNQASAAAADALTLAKVKYRLVYGENDTSWANIADDSDANKNRYDKLKTYLDFPEDNFADYEDVYNATFDIKASLKEKVTYTPK